MIIYKESIAIQDEERTTYYRPTIGSCSCRLHYDGQEHLLFNLDNKRLFYYGLLFQYLHLMLEGRNPLIACLLKVHCRRSRRVGGEGGWGLNSALFLLLLYHTITEAYKRTYSSLGTNSAPAIHFLRNAWYVFSRLLDIPIEESFICPICGPSLETVVCDGVFARTYYQQSTPQSTNYLESASEVVRLALLKVLRFQVLPLQKVDHEGLTRGHTGTTERGAKLVMLAL